MERVLVAVDESASSRDALAYALEQFPEATVQVVHAPETSTFAGDGETSVTDEAEERAEAVLEDAASIASEYDRRIESDVVFGNAAEEILSRADERDVDQIVVGSSGRDGAKRVLLGSVAETVVRRAHCPVTVVR